MTPAFESPALVELGHWLRQQHYKFTAITPATHARVRPHFEAAGTLRDIFGWSVPFNPERFPREAEWLAAADALQSVGVLVKSRVRFATHDDAIFVHSAYPTIDEDSVFFGPDTYRFMRALKALPGPLGRVVDIGTGTGAGGLSIAKHASEVWLCDISDAALAAARTNLALNPNTHVKVARSDLLNDISGDIDTVIANPPFLVDPMQRIYRNGGGTLGMGLTVSIVEQSLARAGQLLLYTGAPIAHGEDLLAHALARFKPHARQWHYEEVDPDIFGETLEEPAYAEVERIAAVTLLLVK